jgi:membrane-bound metal-dependent hydrolase YbcI (DUF457 family)
MPSPIGHALGGAIVAVLLRPAAASPTPPGRSALRATLLAPSVVVAAIAAVAPDLDFLWGRHNMETHSIGAAVVAGLATWILVRDPRLGLTVACAWLSHVLFDWLGSDDTPPLGVMALWPLTTTFYFADAFVFEAISRRYWLDNFWRHNLWAVFSEIAMLLPVLAAVVWWRRRSGARDAA